MIQLNCWNEYDTLKTVILGTIYSDDKIPKLYNDAEQEYFIKIVNGTNEELKNLETILKQNNIKVLRPTQPENINEDSSYQAYPLINMRDFHMVYGNIMFITNGPYKERRFSSLWLEDLTNQIINDNNLVISANEINLQNNLGKNYEEMILDLENYFQVKFQKKLKIKNKENFHRLIDNFSEENNDEDWFLKHNFYNANKNTFHTASILKMNDICFMSQFSGSNTGKKWMKNWLKTLNVSPIELPIVGHIDATCCIVNQDTIITHRYIKHYDNFFKKIHYVDMDQEEYNNYEKLSEEEIFIPSLYYKKWQPLFHNVRKSINALTIRPNVVLLDFYDKDFYKKLKNDGIEAIYIKWSHSKFWEGGLHCITCDIERRPE